MVMVMVLIVESVAALASDISLASCLCCKCECDIINTCALFFHFSRACKYEYVCVRVELVVLRAHGCAYAWTRSAVVRTDGRKPRKGGWRLPREEQTGGRMTERTTSKTPQ